MNYENVVKDFAERTKVNLELIRDQKKPRNEIYEVTQLVNSMMGLLIFPKEKYWFNKIHNEETHIDKIKYSQAISLGWPCINPVVYKHPTHYIDEEKSRFGNEVSFIRNAFAHNNIDFISEETNIDSKPATQIVAVELVNKHNGRITWQAILSIAQLEKIADVFLEIILRDNHAQDD